MIGRLIKLGVSYVVSLADTLRASATRLAGRKPAPVCIVLYYHAIPASSRRAFASQMDDLKRLSTLLRADCAEPLESGRRYAVVTFDDGFVSVVENALPELRDRRIPCTIFVPSGSLGTRPSWLTDGHPDGRETVLSSDGLRAVSQDDSVIIGSHSISHPNFRALDDAAAAVEFIRSKSTLESITKRPVSLFSFPHGAYRHRSLELARSAGYTRVFTIEPTIGPDLQHFAVGRVKIGTADWPIEFRLKAVGAYRWLSTASAWKQRLRRSVPTILKLSPLKNEV